MCIYKPKKISERKYLIQKRLSVLGLFGWVLPVETINGTRKEVNERIKELKNEDRKTGYGIFSFFIW